MKPELNRLFNLIEVEAKQNTLIEIYFKIENKMIMKMKLLILGLFVFGFAITIEAQTKHQK